MKSLLLVSAYLASVLGPSVAFAAFPPKIIIHFKEKTSCRDAKKLLKPNRLYVSCQANSMRSISYSADYLGRTPLNQVIATLTGNVKVQTISPQEESNSATQGSPLSSTVPPSVY